LWVAREGQPSQLLVDWKPGVSGYFPLAAGPLADNQRFGKVWLLPYMTNKNAAQVHPLAQTWYDEVIISTQKIADPSAGTTTPTPATTTLSALPGNTAMDLGIYQCTDPVGESAANCRSVTDYSGMVYDPSRQRMVVFGGGHASTNYNAVNTFQTGALKWVEEYLPTPATLMTVANYDYTRGAWLSGPTGAYPLPAARHTVDQMVVVGDELILLATVEGNGMFTAGDQNPYTSYKFATHGRIAHYNFVTKSWSFASEEGITDWPGTALDPVSGKVVVLGTYTLSLYDPVARTRTAIFDFSTSAGAAHLKDESGNPVSNALLGINRNLVYFPPKDRFYYIGGAGTVFELNLDRSNFGNSTVTSLTTSGTPLPGQEMGFAYDSKYKIIGGGPIANVFYAFDPATKTWTSKVVQGGTPGSLAFHAIDYDPVNDVFIFLTDYASGRRTWAYRYAP
jgi:hypothetical protein